MKRKVLWIEDGAFVEAARLSGSVYTSGKYDLTIALDASEGIRQLMKTEFDAVIVDIRIPPGDDQKWIDLFGQKGFNKSMARLGMHLLYSLLKPTEAKVKLREIPQWVKPNRFGILTVESQREVAEDLKKLGIQVFQQKTADVPQSTLLDLIEKIVHSRKSLLSEGD